MFALANSNVSSSERGMRNYLDFWFAAYQFLAVVCQENYYGTTGGPPGEADFCTVFVVSQTKSLLHHFAVRAWSAHGPNISGICRNLREIYGHMKLMWKFIGSNTPRLDFTMPIKAAGRELVA